MWNPAMKCHPAASSGPNHGWTYLAFVAKSGDAATQRSKLRQESSNAAIMLASTVALGFTAAVLAVPVGTWPATSEPMAPADVRDLLMRCARPFPRGVDKRGCGTGILDIPAALKAWDAAAAAHTGPPDEFSEDDRRPRDGFLSAAHQ